MFLLFGLCLKEIRIESYVIRKERCPECAKLGRDQSHDNLAIYSDGHSYCYSCGFSNIPNVFSRFRRRSNVPRELDKQKSGLYLPEDSDVEYPSIALDWVEQYEITKTNLLNNGVLWSPSGSRLIFPIYNSDHSLLAYQGRYFGPKAPEGKKPYPKWFGKGNLRDTFNILGRSSPILVLTEDIISAMKVSRFVQAMPLYGCVVGTTRFKRLRMLLEPSVEVMVWLDPDKRKEALQEARIGNLCGVRTSTIFSEKDPKEHSYLELGRILNEKISLAC